MRVIPVIDILNGVAVHAVRGKRKEYRPIKSVLTDSTRPIDIAVAFKTAGFSELYVADLDAITGKVENLCTIEEIAKKTGLQVMLDAGISDLTQAQRLLQHKISKVIIGTETLTDFTFVKKAIECFGKERIIVSIDMNAGQVLSKSESARSLMPLMIATQLVGLGVSELILLDLARVGSGQGVDFALPKEIISKLNVKELVGGGIRGIDDLVALKNLGVDGLLVATCLHSGRVSTEELRRLKLL